MTFLPSSIVSFADFREAHPEGVVLSRDTGFSRRYGQNPCVGYDNIGSSPFLFRGEIDGPLDGEPLEPIIHADHFWFSWAAFKPDTIIYSASN